MSNSIVVLGINYGGHDTSAALMCDGQLVAACEEERYNREKHSRVFPIEAVKDCLKQAQLSISDVNELAFAFDPIYHIQERYLRPAVEDSIEIGRIIDDIERIKENFTAETMIRNRTKYSGPITYFKHHHCHLASAYFPSGFDEALLASYDGIGEFETGMLGIGRSGRIEVFHETTQYPDSLGLLYSAITFFLGWRHHCDEGIIMGLATYGNAENRIPNDGRTYLEVFEEIIIVLGSYDYQINREWIAYHQARDRWISDLFYSVFGPRRRPENVITQHHMDIAAALQYRLEQVVIDQLIYAREQSKISQLCMSGGVALNCSLNGRLEKTKIFDEIFIQPASGDAGVAVGACYLAYSRSCPALKPQKQHNFYLGSGFTEKELENALTNKNLPVNKIDNIFEHTAEKLAQGEIIGWYQGRSEFGPRALGNRSILTRPYPSTMKDYLNERVKFREPFRPFAPAILYEYLEDYFDIRQESPHMLIACQATDIAKRKIPATVHVDNTCRVQSVKFENNEMFYRLLSAFFDLTECPVLLNTSFNVKGQPIVNSPEQAIDCYLSTNIDCLILGDYILTKN